MPADPRWASGWRWLLILVGLGLLAALARLQTLDVGLMSDDFAQHGMLAGLYPGEGYAPFDLYAFFRDDPELLAAQAEAGTVPWWTAPGLHGTVMRPLSSALLTLDHALAPHAARLWHAHSLLWLAAMVVSAGLALRRLLPPSIAALALVLLACEAGVATPLAWLANRCVLVSVSFGFLALWAHVSWRELEVDSPRRRRWIAAEVGLAALALAAGEYGLACVAYVLAYELLGAKAAPLRARASALLPALLLTGTWLITHRVLGYGTSGSEVYVDPFTAPQRWLALAAERLPKLALGAFWSIPADTGDMLRRFGSGWVPWTLSEPPTAAELQRAHLIVSALLLPLAALALGLVRRALSEDERRALRFLTLGALLGLLPLTVAPAHSRLLIPAQLGSCALVAATIVGAARLVSSRVPGPRPHLLRRVLPLPIAAALLWSHTWSDLRYGRAYLVGLTSMNRSIEAAFTRGDLLGDDLDGRDVIVLNAVGQTVALHGHYLIHAHGGPTPRTWRSLAMAEFPMVAMRTRADTLELSAIQAGWLYTGGELFFRHADQLLPAGTAFEIPGLAVEVTADVDGHPTRIEFRFPSSLDDPRYLFLICTPEGLRRWQVPKLGKRAPVPIPKLPLVGPGEQAELR
ncbi:hypothetical protein ENSA5_55250 [Enhygromyxa salina]|uniref:Glycosyltransferase RgtA/B/C/D-like domain-containing protein n=1 Tax=Enhygromyxa salina TaxID=215803 RepID=A0A2S9XEV9_9BACT|nr:hypothetical protein [Enhygromyxa salina]PRP91408.1 hypothetical protein ENSA5_55250 [Enhygromyxa salina]